MALAAYCELDEVRAALGVSDAEISDVVLSLPVYEIGLVRELNRVSTSLPVAFSTVSNIAEVSRSANEQALFDATRLFCVYACARQVGVSLGSMVPKDISDGKASLARFSDSPYKDVLERVDTLYSAVRKSLLDVVIAYTGAGTSSASTVPMTIFKASSRAYDPVTGV